MQPLLSKIYNLLSETAPTPPIYGAYHLGWIVATFVLCGFLILLFSNCSDRTARAITAALWVLILIFELGKQLQGGLTPVDGRIIFDYKWAFFPYQFCSTPLYVMPFVAFMRDGEKRSTAIIFLATFSVIGGVVVLAAPHSVLVPNLFLSAQSMLHHGVQVAIGIYLSVRYRAIITFRRFFRATILFVFLTYLAILLNVFFQKYFHIGSMDESINLFFVSPHIRYVPEILEGVGVESLPYPIFLLGYIALFIIVAYLLMRGESYFARKAFHENKKTL